MKIAIISDVHGNLEALEAVIRDASSHDVDDYFCLGDIVGYGPYPKECLDRIRQITDVIIKGNHEDGVSDLTVQAGIKNTYAAAGMKFSFAALAHDDILFIRDLPQTIARAVPPVVLAHGAFTRPHMWRYIETAEEITSQFEYFVSRFGFLGHTHVPFCYGSRSKFVALASGEPILLPTDERFIFNVGSVGQPRDGDNRASYGILDFESSRRVAYEPCRVDYDIKKTAKAIRQAGLPSFLAERLFLGN